MNAEKGTLRFLLWDVDGVLVDTEELKFEGWRLLAEQFGKTLTLKEYLPCIGHGSKENMRAICAMKNISGTYEELNPIRRKYYEEIRAKGAPIFQSNIDLVKEFKQICPALIHGVVSSAPRKEVLDNIHAAGFSDDFFAVIVSFEDSAEMKRKPAPDMYLYTLKKLGADASECIAFEDSGAGTTAASEAGIFCVGLPNELTEQQDLQRARLIIPRTGKRSAADIVKAFDQC